MKECNNAHTVMNPLMRFPMLFFLRKGRHFLRKFGKYEALVC